MRFNILGPLKVRSEETVVSLGGFNQRATLGALLLRPNKVVATSHLVKALWGDNPPVTARKMLQNAISNLRLILNKHTDAVLLTQSPGYLLQVEPDDVDLLRFQFLVEQGRKDYEAGAQESAAKEFREALGLWRGPVLADLMENGINWPELTVLENARLSAFEDYVDAQLAAGRHATVVSELERATADSELPRERMCGQLMLALYRCGRQVDALKVYRRTRTDLIEKLGLDPGRELQELERAILSHDPSLAAPRVAVGGGQPVTPSGVAPRQAGRPDGEPDRPAWRADLESPASAAADEPAALAAAADTSAVAEFKRISVLHVQVRLSPVVREDPEEINTNLKDINVGIHEEVERFGGVVQGLFTEGVGWVALFGVPRIREDDAERAIRAALAIRDRFESRSADVDAPVSPVTVNLAVATGEALVTSLSDDTHAETIGVLDQCRRLAGQADPGEVRACPATRQGTERVFTFTAEPDGARGAAVLGLRPDAAGQEVVPFLERNREIGVLSGLLCDVRLRQRPYLVTVLGEPGIGKSRLIEELGRQTSRHDEAVRWLVARTPAFAADATASVIVQLARSYAGISHSDPEAVSRRRLWDVVDRLVETPGLRKWLLSHLYVLLRLAEDYCAEPRIRTTEGALVACRHLMEMIAIREPTVVVIEDLHLGDDGFLDFVENFVDWSARMPLLVITTSRTELLLRRSRWGGGKRNAFTLTLEPLSHDTMGMLIKTLERQYGLCADPRPEDESYERTAGAPVPQSPVPDAGQRTALLNRIGGNPRFAVEYFRMRREQVERARGRGVPSDAVFRNDHADVLSFPGAVWSIISARLDMLSPIERSVLQDAAVFGDTVWPSAVAAISGREYSQVARCLAHLERCDLLYRVGHSTTDAEPLSAFRHPLIRDVAYAQLPPAVREEVCAGIIM